MRHRPLNHVLARTGVNRIMRPATPPQSTDRLISDPNILAKLQRARALQMPVKNQRMVTVSLKFPAAMQLQWMMVHAVSEPGHEMETYSTGFTRPKARPPTKPEALHSPMSPRHEVDQSNHHRQGSAKELRPIIKP